MSNQISEFCKPVRSRSNSQLGQEIFDLPAETYIQLRKHLIETSFHVNFRPCSNSNIMDRANANKIEWNEYVKQFFWTIIT